MVLRQGIIQLQLTLRLIQFKVGWDDGALLSSLSTILSKPGTKDTTLSASLCKPQNALLRSHLVQHGSIFLSAHSVLCVYPAVAIALFQWPDCLLPTTSHLGCLLAQQPKHPSWEPVTPSPHTPGESETLYSVCWTGSQHSCPFPFMS